MVKIGRKFTRLAMAVAQDVPFSLGGCQQGLNCAVEELRGRRGGRVSGWAG